MRWLLIGMLFVMGTVCYGSEDFDRQQIELRIKPIGEVQIEQKANVKVEPTQTTQKEEAKAESPGENTYEHYCITCHRDGVAGAPKFRNAADWGPRLKEQKIEGLLANALKGINAMPPKGTCMDCSETDIKEAIQYMLPKS